MACFIRTEEFLFSIQVKLAQSRYNDIYFIHFGCLFFCFQRHFIVLIASTPVKEQYMDWVRMVESKIRFLIQVLEKNQYINLAHINPQGYEEIKEVYE